MVVTAKMLMEQYAHYKNPKAKIQRLVDCGELFPVKRGLYETEKHPPEQALAGAIYGPSYISFDYALSYYGLIPEAVFVVTSATCRKRKIKEYTTPFGRFLYRDVPAEAFPVGIVHIEVGRDVYRIACPEKALCDKLYAMPPVTSQKDIIAMLIEDLRIDEDEFEKMDAKKMIQFSEKYHSNNLKYLAKYLRRRNAIFE